MSITIIFYVQQNYSIPGGPAANSWWRYGWREGIREGARQRLGVGARVQPLHGVLDGAASATLLPDSGIPGTPPNFSASGDLSSHLARTVESGGWALGRPVLRQCVGEEEREL
jgi:hypothetical protein